MKKIISAIVTLSGALLASNITAVKVDADLSSVSYKSKVWSEAKFSEVMLYPQTTITFNDKKANELNAENKAKLAQVAALYNENNIAFIIKWKDDTINIQQSYKSNEFADGFALQFASDFSDAEKLPYIGMGSEGREVIVHLQKAARSISEPNGKGNVFYQQNPNQTNLFDKELESFNKKVKKRASNDYERTFIAAGFRSMSEIKDGSSKSYARIQYSAGKWTGTLSRSMKDDYVNFSGAQAIPVAFAVWDGAKMGRDGLKNLSQWISVTLEDDTEVVSPLVDALQTSPSKGDANEGKKVVEANGCIGCHQIEKSDARSFMGPALYNVGGYATNGYLRESLIDTTAVVVPGYNRNAHKNYAWYTLEGDKRISTMPSFSHLSATELDNVVAYLKTLKAEVE